MKTSQSLVLALSLSLVAVAACSNKQDEPASAPAAAPTPAAKPVAAATATALSCTNPSASQCTDFPGGDEALVKQQCDLIDGKFAASACPVAKKLGTCELSGMHKLITYYPGGDDNLDAKLAGDDCKAMNGTWHP